MSKTNLFLKGSEHSALYAKFRPVAPISLVQDIIKYHGTAGKISSWKHRFSAVVGVCINTMKMKILVKFSFLSNFFDLTAVYKQKKETSCLLIASLINLLHNDDIFTNSQNYQLNHEYLIFLVFLLFYLQFFFSFFDAWILVGIK